MEEESQDYRIKPGQTYDNIFIESIGERGDGVARIKNFVVFIKDADMDCTYNIKIKKVFNKYAFAEINEDNIV